MGRKSGGPKWSKVRWEQASRRLDRAMYNLEEEHKPSVTLPKFTLPEIDIERETREAAARVAERKFIRAGLDAWRALGKADSYESWKAISAALSIGRAFALRSTGANRPEGQIYCKAFSRWINEHGFAAMQKSVRSTYLELHTHINEITAWRDTLPEKQKRRLVHPLSVTRRWKASLAHGQANARKT
jgi:hypothetical protein